MTDQGPANSADDRYSLERVVWQRIDRAFAGWEQSLDTSGPRSELERIWYGRLDEAVGAGIHLGILEVHHEEMLEARVNLLDPTCDSDGPLGRWADAMNDPDLAELREVAGQVRRALEAGGLRSVGFGAFPRGSCGDASQLLGRYLSDEGHGEWMYTMGLGPEPRGTHAWVQRGDIIIDITADQFDEIDEAVVVTRDWSWHAQFGAGKGSRVAGTGFLGPNSAVLDLDYATVVERIENLATER